MPIITTKVLGISASEADPKPTTGFDYAGQPMKPGAPYNGRPEHMAQNAPGSPVTRPKKLIGGLSREDFIARIRAGRERAKARREKAAARKAAAKSATDSQSTVSPSIDSEC